MAPIPGQLIEFPRSQAPETDEQKALRELKQREAQEFSAAQFESAPGSNMKTTADVAPFPAPPVTEFLDKNRTIDPVAAHSEEQIDQMVRELETSPNPTAVLNRWMNELEAKNLDPGDILEAQARAKRAA